MTSILVVCTGNICRSPVAEGFLIDSFSRRFGDGGLTVSSAGIAGLEGSPSTKEAIISAAEYGTDIQDHRARMLRRDMLDADLIVGMASEHRDTVIEMEPSTAGRSFTLKELVRLLEELDPVAGQVSPGGGHGAEPSALVGRLARAEELRRSGFSGNPRDESVVDPIGQGLTTYRAVASELQEWTRRLVVGLFGPQEPRASDVDDRTRGAVG